MIRSFITTLILHIEDFVTKIDTYILNLAKAKFDKKCFNGYFIREVLYISRKGRIVTPRNDYTGILQCDIEFVAKCETYEKHDLIAVTITELSVDTVVCSTEAYKLCLKLTNDFNFKVGNKFIACIANIDFDPVAKITMTATYFKPNKIMQITEVVNTNDEFTEIMQNTLNIFADLQKELQKNENAKKIAAMLSPKYKTANSIFESYNLTNLPDLKKLPQDTVYFIMNYGEPAESGVFYIAPCNTPPEVFKKEGSFRIHKEGISLAAIIHRYASSLCNYIEVILDMCSHISNNDEVWEKYKQLTS